MTPWHCNRLGENQIRSVEERLDGVQLVDDMSWNLVDTVVLHVKSGDDEFVVKGAPPSNHHIGREITAHLTAASALAQHGRAAWLVHHDRAANLLVTTYLPGALTAGTDSEFDIDVHRQAGEILRMLHDQGSHVDLEWDAAATSKTLDWLDTAHRIRSDTAARVTDILRRHRPHAVDVVPTHGDWHPRNWLVDDGEVRMIDFGRFDLRPAQTDFARLAVQQWRGAPHLESAFVEGYGREPRDPQLWRIIALREAVATAVWAYRVGDAQFEQQGHRMIDDALLLS